ncbi:MAG: hypothetical protein ACYC27_03635 [Armatimonadota bacterium]
MIYRYRTLPIQWIALVISIPMSFFGVGVSVLLAWLYQTHEKPAAVVDQLVFSLLIAFLLIITIAFLGLSIFKLIQEVLSTRRVCISVEDSGLRVTNWRGRETFYLWDTISELRMMTFTGIFTQPLARMISTIGNLTITAAVERQKTLINEIINRAHLTSVSNDIYQTRYYRSAAGTPAVS